MRLYGHGVVATIFFLFIVNCPLLATNHYVRSAATGNGSGSDWTNACTGFTGSCASLVRGDTYYVADGSYATPKMSTATSGTIPVTLKRATSADHGGCDPCGWSDAFATQQAVFNGGMVFTTANWIVDGVTGGGPGSWNSGFGFKISSSAASPLVDVSTSSANNVTLRHVELQGTSNSSGGGSIAQDAFAIRGGSNFTVSYFYTHAIGRCPFFFVSAPNAVIEYGYIGDFVSTSAAHSEVLSTQNWNSGDMDFRYNVIAHIEGTGGLMWDNSGNHNSQFRIYGNVFYRAATDNTWDNNANGLIGGWTGGNGEDCYNLRVYNNTFININGTLIFTNFILRFGNNVAENNLFYNSVSADYTDIGTHDYNEYVNSGGTHSEPNGTSPTGDPFISEASLNFRLSASTSAGTTLGSPFTTDVLGNTRGADGVWDRGAFEFSSSQGTAPAPPTALVAAVN